MDRRCRLEQYVMHVCCYQVTIDLFGVCTAFPMNNIGLCTDGPIAAISLVANNAMKLYAVVASSTKTRGMYVGCR